jgi:hypothetical protein
MSYQGRDIKVKGLVHEMPIKCPQCDKRLKQIPFMYAATLQSTRSCPQCKTTWRILAKPNRRQPGYDITILDWLAIESTSPKGQDHVK